MANKTSDFPRPQDPGPRARLDPRRFRPILGINRRSHPADLVPGEAQLIRNFIIQEDTLQPRNGSVEFVPTIAGIPPTIQTPPFNDLWNIQAFSRDAQGAAEFIGAKDIIVGISDKTIANIIPNDTLNFQSWTIASGPGLVAPGADGGNAAQGSAYDMTESYVPSASSDFVFIAGSGQTPLIYDDSQNSYSILTSFESSGFSAARFVEAFDDRVIFQYLEKASGDQVTGLRWSQRGNPLNFHVGVGLGPGGDSLPSMPGLGRGLLALEDRCLAFSTDAVYQMIPRRDPQAFDIVPVDQAKGCYAPRSITRVPQGVFWVGDDLHIYFLQGDETFEVGRKVREILTESVAGIFNDSLQGFYDAENNSFVLFYQDDDISASINRGNANASLELFLDTLQPTGQGQLDGTWVQHIYTNFPIQAVTAARVRSQAGNIGRNPKRLWYASDNSIYQNRRNLTTDDGSVITATYDSHAFTRSRFDPLQQEQLNEVWINTYDTSASTATVDVLQTVDFGQNFTSLGTITTSAETPSQFVTVSAPAARYPQVRLQVNDGSQPRIDSVNVKMRGWQGDRRG